MDKKLTIPVNKIEQVYYAIRGLILKSDEDPSSIPVAVAYYAARILKKIEPEFESLQKIKNPLLNKYAEEILQNSGGFDKENKPVLVPTGKFKFNSLDSKAHFEKEMDEAYSEKDISVDMYKLKASKLIQAKIGASYFVDLDCILEYDLDDEGNPIG